MTKVCPRCQVRKPWSDFYVRTRWDDGTPRTVHAYCRPCNAAKRKESYARHPGSKAAACRAYRARLAEDPVRLADYREKQRVYVRVWALRHGSRVGMYASTEPCPKVPTPPFAAWLRTLGENPNQIARECGLHDRQVRVYLSGKQATVELDVVDRACLFADADLNDLYPLDDQLQEAA